MSSAIGPTDDDKEEWIDPEFAELILEQDRCGEWSDDMTAEELLGRLEKLGQVIH